VSGAIRFYRRGVFVCLLSVGVALGCRSSQGNGVLRAEQITAKIEQAKTVLRNPNATQAARKAAAETLTEAARDAGRLGQDVDTNKTIADDNAAAASKWRTLRNIAVSLGTAAALYFLFRRR